MPDHVYKSVELTGSSHTSIEDAVNTAVSKAAQTIHNIRWFEVNSIRGVVEADTVTYWQVSMKLGFTLDQ